MEQTVNSVNEAVQKWNQREKENSMLFPEIMNSAAFARVRLRELNIIRARFKNSSNPSEQLSLKYLKLEAKRLRKIGLKSKYNWRFIVYFVVEPFIVNKIAAKLNKEEKSNHEVFIESLHRLGYGEYADKIMEMINQGKKNFSYTFPYQSTEAEVTSFMLNIGYNDTNGYHLNTVRAAYSDKKKPGEVRYYQIPATRDCPEPKVIANIVAGRPVYDARNGWRQLDLTDKDAQGNHPTKKLYAEGFDVEEACQKLPIWEKLSVSQQVALPERIKSGERPGMTFEHLGAKNTVFLEANPTKQRMLAFNDKGKVVDLEKTFAPKDIKMTVVKSPNQNLAPLTQKAKLSEQKQEVKHRIKIRPAHKLK